MTFWFEVRIWKQRFWQKKKEKLECIKKIFKNNKMWGRMAVISAQTLSEWRSYWEENCHLKRIERSYNLGPKTHW